jgi:5-methylcytosine-specific restriction endonuclease McrA
VDLEVHHVKYPENFSKDRIENLVVACVRHHSLAHGVRLPRNYRRRKAHHVQPYKNEFNKDGTNQYNDFENYEDCLTPTMWAELKDEALKRSNYRCEFCRSTKNLKDLKVHHVKSSKNFSHAPVDNLVVSCVRCYKLQHGERIPKRTRRKPVKGV